MCMAKIFTVVTARFKMGCVVATVKVFTTHRTWMCMAKTFTVGTKHIKMG